MQQHCLRPQGHDQPVIAYWAVLSAVLPAAMITAIIVVAWNLPAVWVVPVYGGIGAVIAMALIANAIWQRGYDGRHASDRYKQRRQR